MPHVGRWPDHDSWEKDGSPRIQPKKIPPCLPEYVGIVARLAAAGNTRDDICRVLGVSKHTFQFWCKNNADFKQAWLHAKEQIRSELVVSGIEQAKGYTIVDEEVSTDGIVDESGAPHLTTGMPVRVKRITRHIPGNAILLKFILSGLDRQLGGEDWQEKRTIENIERRAIDISAVARQIEKLSGERPALSAPIDTKFEEKEVSECEGLQTPE